MARKIIQVPPLCKINKDNLGTSFSIEHDGFSPQVEIWWDRSTEQELLFVRQEIAGAKVADVVTLSIKQLYATIDALNRAVMEI